MMGLDIQILEGFMNGLFAFLLLKIQKENESGGF
jgi:hypothetical protein